MLFPLQHSRGINLLHTQAHPFILANIPLNLFQQVRVYPMVLLLTLALATANLLHFPLESNL